MWGFCIYNMLRIGITGGIGSGKSTVAGVFEVLGIPVAYADREAKRIMTEDPILRQQIVHHFGAAAYTGHQLNRPYLAAQVFNNKEKLDLLNSLVHPATIAAGEKWMIEQQKSHAPYAIREAALIFESDSVKYLDFVIGVYAPPSLRIHRVLQRDKLTREEILQRMSNQIDEDIKMKLCDAVVYNDEQHPVIPQVLQLHERLLQQAAAMSAII
jgi:dephospho-CoA kinase